MSHEVINSQKHKNATTTKQKSGKLGTEHNQQVKQLLTRDHNHPKTSDIRTNDQRKANKTGLPDQLKNGVEALSGYSMDDVRVHYNSAKPAELDAHAFAQGSEIHLASGAEKYLPHEAWHVVQQKQGRVQPTKQLKSEVKINDDNVLERDADLMGERALQMTIDPYPIQRKDTEQQIFFGKRVIQKRTKQEKINKKITEELINSYNKIPIYKKENNSVAKYIRTPYVLNFGDKAIRKLKDEWRNHRKLKIKRDYSENGKWIKESRKYKKLSSVSNIDRAFRGKGSVKHIQIIAQAVIDNDKTSIENIQEYVNGGPENADSYRKNGRFGVDCSALVAYYFGKMNNSNLESKLIYKGSGSYLRYEKDLKKMGFIKIHDNIRIGDIIAQKGHVMIVFDINKLVKNNISKQKPSINPHMDIETKKIIKESFQAEYAKFIKMTEKPDIYAFSAAEATSYPMENKRIEDNGKKYEVGEVTTKTKRFIVRDKKVNKWYLLFKTRGNEMALPLRLWRLMKKIEKEKIPAYKVLKILVEKLLNKEPHEYSYDIHGYKRKKLVTVLRPPITQKKSKECPYSSEKNTFQLENNRTGIPGNLKSGIEFLSGYSMDDVKVHYNSPKPAQLNAHAYIKGTDIHIASGAEKYLPHEAWHVVQQKQGRVQPTRQLRDKIYINDNEGLEREADVMGVKALHIKKHINNSFFNSIKSNWVTSQRKSLNINNKDTTSLKNYDTNSVINKVSKQIIIFNKWIKNLNIDKEIDILLTKELESHFNEYARISVKEKTTRRIILVQTPYFMNITPWSLHQEIINKRNLMPYINSLSASENNKKKHAQLIYLRRAFNRVHKRKNIKISNNISIGKSTSQDIAKFLQKIIDNNLIRNPTSSSLRAFLIRYGIGVDCSGFVYQSLVNLTEKLHGKKYSKKKIKELNLRKKVNYSTLPHYRRVCTPGGCREIELTDKENKKLTPNSMWGKRYFIKINQLRPGDIMKLKKGSAVGHVRVILKVEKDSGGNYIFTTLESRGGEGMDKVEWRYRSGSSEYHLLEKRSSSSRGRWTRTNEKPLFVRSNFLSSHIGNRRQEIIFYIYKELLNLGVNIGHP